MHEHIKRHAAPDVPVVVVGPQNQIGGQLLHRHIAAPHAAGKRTRDTGDQSHGGLRTDEPQVGHASYHTGRGGSSRPGQRVAGAAIGSIKQRTIQRRVRRARAPIAGVEIIVEAEINEQVVRAIVIEG